MCRTLSAHFILLWVLFFPLYLQSILPVDLSETGAVCRYCVRIFQSLHSPGHHLYCCIRRLLLLLWEGEKARASWDHVEMPELVPSPTHSGARESTAAGADARSAKATDVEAKKAKAEAKLERNKVNAELAARLAGLKARRTAATADNERAIAIAREENDDAMIAALETTLQPELDKMDREGLTVRSMIERRLAAIDEALQIKLTKLGIGKAGGCPSSEPGADSDSAAEDCPMCLESFDDPVKTPCEHIFCRGCVAPWLVSGPCPMCRAPCSPADLLPVLSY